MVHTGGEITQYLFPLYYYLLLLFGITQISEFINSNIDKHPKQDSLKRAFFALGRFRLCFIYRPDCGDLFNFRAGSPRDSFDHVRLCGLARTYPDF